MGSGAYLRVSRREPCPICDKHDWCRIFEDGGVECMRVESPVACASGGWMHWTNEDWRDKIAYFPEKHTVTETVGDALLNQVYTKLLGQCPIQAKHFHMLQERGLSPDHYGTLPSDIPTRELIADTVARNLPSRHWLDRTPGFFWIDYAEDAWSINGAPGLLIPIRNHRGYIVGMQIRRDEGDPRYSFLSSRNLPRGTGSGSPPHLAMGFYFHHWPIIITEGPLKADYLATKEFNAIAVPGVNNIRGVLPMLRQIHEHEGSPSRVVVCYDMDWKTNKQVKAARARLMQMLWCEGYQVSSFSWDPSYKGIDDALRAGCDLVETDYDPDGAVPCSRLFEAD